ncbi:MAG: DUF6427 family protein [Odoribacteraceae bacterium]|jgi:hypothetical protein|nr:DUF6427 family protein [Odoribacteraceae bacterium]
MSIEQIIQTKRIHLLFLLPFILAGIIAGYRYLGESTHACSEEGIIALPFLDKYHDTQWLFWLGALWLLLLSYLLFFIADRHRELSRTTVLPAFIYLILSAGLFCRHGLNAYAIAAAPVALAIDRLQLIITRLNSNAPVFDFGLLIAITVLLCPKLALLLPWAILVLPFSGRSTLKDMMALLLGFVTVLLFIVAYFFLFDNLETVRDRIMNALHAGEWPDYRFHPLEWVAIALLVAVSLATMTHALTRTLYEAVSRRREILAMISLSFFLGSTFLLIPLPGHTFLFVLFVPLSYLYAHYFASYRRRYVGRLLLLALLTASMLMIL